MQTIRDLFESVARGEIKPEEAEKTLLNNQVAEMGFATLDLQRPLRRGRPEVILCESKTTDQVIKIAQRFLDSNQGVMMTRLTASQLEALPKALESYDLHVSEEARFAWVDLQPVKRKEGLIGVFAAGTSDIPVAEEAALTAECFGSTVRRAYDVGVAGLHRLFRHSELICEARVLIVVAGMEGALPSVVSGLTRAPVISVPVSVGYGASFGGLSALLTMINSCSPGIGVVNIDNGFGAGYLADAINEIGEK